MCKKRADGWRRLHEGGDSHKEQTGLKMRIRREEIEVQVAKWSSVEYREEVHEKIQRHV